jgi:hypothetical protein
VACGQQHGTGPAASPSDPSSPAGSPSTAPAGCHGARLAPVGTLNVSSIDNGKSLCVTQSTGVLVTLRGMPGRTWTPVQVSGTALARRANGRLALARWVTGAYFVAVHPGTAMLSSMRPVCQVPASSAPSSPGTARCGAEQAFRVTIVVAGR